MARKAKANGQPIEDPTPEPEPVFEAPGGHNVSDEVKRDYYRKALIAKIGLESAQATAKTRNGEYRSVLKDAKKAGVDTDAITRSLALRFRDHDELVLQVREELKMLDLSGVIPNIKEKLLARLDVEEPTRNEAHEMTIDRAYDDGAFSGREGAPRDSNPHRAGSDLYDTWDRGWLLSQAAIANEMHPAHVQ